MKQIFMFLGIFMVFLACNESKKGNDASQPENRTVNSLKAIAGNHKVPFDFILAVAILESNLNPVPQGLIYTGTRIQLPTAQSAFGHSFRFLGLENDPNNDKINVQMEAFIVKFNSFLAERSIKLPHNPGNLRDRFQWIWELAQFQRSGDLVHNNTRKIFTKELINILNGHHYLPIASTTDYLTQTPQSPKIDIDQIPEIQTNLNLSYSLAEITGARYFENDNTPSTIKNKPTHVKIVHCPKSISSCLEIFKLNSDFQMGKISGHYIIPQDKSIFEKPIQITYHDLPILKTASDGVLKIQDDAITIILTGKSGHYVEGKRELADPTWFKDYQLKQLGALLDQICKKIHSVTSNPSAYNECKTPSDESIYRPRFYLRNSNEEYKWGQIPDFNKSIVWGYLIDPTLSTQDLYLKHISNNQIYDAYKEIEIKSNLPLGTKILQIDISGRCENNHLVWQIVQRNAVNNLNEYSAKFKLYGKGPNNNGDHFVRFLASDMNGKLLAWNTTKLTISNYDQHFTHKPSLDLCFF